MKKGKLSLILVAVAVAIGGIVFLANRAQKGAELQRITIGTFSEAIDYAPLYVAQSFGWFEEELKALGISAVPLYRSFVAFLDIETAFSQDSLHAFFCAEAPATKIFSDKQDVRIVEVGCTLQQEVLVQVELAIESVDQLRGKTIAVAEGTSSHYGLLKILRAAGLSAKDVTLRPGFPGTIKPLFESNHVDAWAVWPPFVEEQVLAKRGKALHGGDAKIHSVMVLPVSLMQDHPMVASKLVEVIQRAKTWIAGNPEEAQSIVAKKLNYSLDVVRLAWPKHNWGATLTDDVKEDMQEKSQFLTDQNVVQGGRVIDVRQELIDDRYLKP